MAVALADYKNKNVDQIMAERPIDDKEIRALLAWSNSYLAQRTLSADSLENFGDGVLLINLLETTFKAHLGKYSARPKLAIQKLENVSIAFDFMKKQDIPLISIDTHDIVQTKTKHITIVLWLILRFILLRNMGGTHDPTTEDGKKHQTNIRDRLLTWIKENFPSQDINDFGLSFRDGVMLCHIVDKMVPGKIDISTVKTDNALENARLAFSVAEENLGIPTLIDPEELTGSGPLDEKPVMNYVAMLLSAAKVSERKEQELALQKQKEAEAKEQLGAVAKSAEEAKLAAEKAAEEALRAAEAAAEEAKAQEEKRQALIQQKTEEILKLKDELHAAQRQIESAKSDIQERDEKLTKEAEAKRAVIEEGEVLRKNLEKVTAQYEESTRQISSLETKVEEQTNTHKREVEELKARIEQLQLDHKQQLAQLAVTQAAELQQARDAYNKQLDKLMTKEAQTEEEKKELEARIEKEKQEAAAATAAAKEQADKVAQEAKEAQLREQERAKKQAEADQLVIKQKSEEIAKLSDEVSTLTRKLEASEGVVAATEKKLGAEKETNAALTADGEKLRKQIQELIARAEKAEGELFSLRNAQQAFKSEVQELISQIRLRVHQLKAQYRASVQRSAKQAQADLLAQKALLKKEEDEHRKEVLQLNSELYLLYREHEGVLARVREEKKKNYEDLKRSKPNFESPRPTLSITDRLGAALREQKTDKDFLEAMKPKSGWLLRRRPKAVFNSARFKKVYFVLRGDTLEYYTKLTSVDKLGAPKGKFSLKEYATAETISTSPNNFTFKLTPIKGAHDSNIALELKAAPEDSEADEKKGVSDHGIKDWMYEINRRIAVNNYLESVKKGKQKGCRELLDFVVADHAETLWIEDKLQGIHAALLSLQAALTMRQNLHHIHLRNISLSDAALSVIVDILKLNNNIESIELPDNLITEEGAGALAEGLKLNKSLTVLDLDNNQLKDEGLRKIAEALPHHRSLRNLSINGNAIGDKGVQALATGLVAAGGDPLNFPTINLKYNLVGDAGCIALADMLKKNPSVTEITLEHNMVTDEGFGALMRAVPSSSLTLLNLSENQVSSKGILELTSALKSSKHDFTIDLSNNTLLGGAGIGALVKTELKLDYLLFKIRRKIDGGKDEGKDGAPRSSGTATTEGTPTLVITPPSSTASSPVASPRSRAAAGGAS